jgi:hypothetical protein
MTERPGRSRGATWSEDTRGGVRSIGLEVLIVLAIVLYAAAIAWIAIAVV